MRNILAILLMLGLSLRAADVPLSSQTRTAYIHPLNTLVAVSTNLSSTYYSRAINASNFLESILTYPNWPSLTKVQTTNLVNTTVNLASNALQTQITAILSATNFANVIDYGATADGTSLASPGTDDTAAFANAIASGQAVYVPKTAGYFSITNLTNSTLIFGGGRILMRPTSTNFAIYFGMMAHSGNGYAGTNVDWSGIGMQDIELWGGGTNFLGGLGNRHGVNFNPYGQGNILQNCYIHGFNGVGVQSTSTKPFAGVPPFLDIDQAPGVLNNVTVSNCYYGFHYVGGQPIGIPASSDVYLSEYLRSQGLMATGNKVGMWLEAGNNQIMNSHFSRNTNGFLITSNQNNAHGAFIGGSINHNDGSGVIASNISFGFVFQGVNMFFNSLYLTNSDGILYQGGIFDHGTVTFGGGGANVFRDNEWLTGAPSIVTTASGKGVAYNYGPADGSSLPVAFPWFLMSTNQHAVRSTNGFFSWSTNKGAVVLGGNYSPTIAENVFNGNSAFNIQANMGYNGSFTFDAAGANRVGFTIRNGFYPWLTFATNTPLYIGENSLADLQDLSANSTHANRPYMSFMGSKITNHVNMYGPMFDAAGNAYSTTGGGGGGGSLSPDGEMTSLMTLNGAVTWVDLGEGMYIDDSLQFGQSIFGGRDFGTGAGNRSFGQTYAPAGLSGSYNWFTCLASNNQYAALRYGSASSTIGAAAVSTWSNRFNASATVVVQGGGNTFTNTWIMFGATSERFDQGLTTDGVKWEAKPAGDPNATWYAGLGIGSTWTYVTSTIPVTNYLVKLSMQGDYQGVAFFTNGVWFAGISNNIPTNRIYSFGVRQIGVGSPATPATNQVLSYWRNLKALIQ